MDAAQTLRTARQRAGLTLRQLAERAGTSHATLSAYEHGRKTPSTDTLERVVRAAGFRIDVELAPVVAHVDPVERGAELLAVLELAAHFPVRHAPTLVAPRFGPRLAGAAAQ
jgi:transcriptional regulator with XRE-family HTH domain